MNWDNRLASVLSAADGSVAKIRERLATSSGKFSGDLFPVREVSGVTDVEAARLPPSTLPSSSHSSLLQRGDLASLQSQLQLHSQAIESLTEKLQNMNIERHSQQRHIQALQEEVCGLREEARQREREREEERAEERRAGGPGTERRMEEWRREVGRELSSLRGHIARASSLGNLEDSFSSKLRREELDHLRRELDQLKTQLRRQEEDMFLLQSESRETRRQCEHGCKTLEELADSYRAHSIDLTKTASQYTHTQQEIRQIRASVTELKEEVRNVNVRSRRTSLVPPPCVQPLPAAVCPVPDRVPDGVPDHMPGPVPGLVPGPVPGPVPAPAPSRRVRVPQEADSDSEDFSPTPSLAEISSDDLSWLEDHVAPPPRRPRKRHTSRGSDPELGSGLDDIDDDDDGGDGNLGLGSDLSLNDL